MTKLLAALAALAACHDTRVHVPATASPPGQLTVTGTATLEVSPDCADLTMTLSADAPAPGPATAAVQREQASLVAALTTLGVAGADLELSYLTLQPVYDPSGLTIRTYRAQITVTATTRDFAAIAPLMEAGAAAGATSLSSAFRRSDLAALKTQVRAMALAAARDKAAQTARTLGIHLGRILSVSETAGGHLWPGEYVPNAIATHAAPATLGGALQPLTLDVTIAYELEQET